LQIPCAGGNCKTLSLQTCAKACAVFTFTPKGIVCSEQQDNVVLEDDRRLSKESKSISSLTRYDRIANMRKLCQKASEVQSICVMKSQRLKEKRKTVEGHGDDLGKTEQ
jgi:hypothetical protein